jgi:hypothetical protein
MYVSIFIIHKLQKFEGKKLKLKIIFKLVVVEI